MKVGISRKRRVSGHNNSGRVFISRNTEKQLTEEDKEEEAKAR
jgi:hypothetical protein